MSTSRGAMRANGRPLKSDFEADSRETLLATALCEIRNILAQHVESQNATDHETINRIFDTIEDPQLFGIFGEGWHLCDRLQRPDPRHNVELLGEHLQK
jgi:regulator of replication initiation timing